MSFAKNFNRAKKNEKKGSLDGNANRGNANLLISRMRTPF